MRHDPQLARPEAHQGWCECRACHDRAASLGAALREGRDCAIAGTIVAVPCAIALTVIRFWPEISTWWWTL